MTALAVPLRHYSNAPSGSVGRVGRGYGTLLQSVQDHVANYDGQLRSETMAAKAPSRENVSFDLFKWVIAGATAVVAGGFWLLHSDIGDLRRGQTDISREIGAMRVDLVKAVGAIETQSALTNAKLQTMIEDGRKR